MASDRPRSRPPSDAPKSIRDAVHTKRREIAQGAAVLEVDDFVDNFLRESSPDDALGRPSLEPPTIARPPAMPIKTVKMSAVPIGPAPGAPRPAPPPQTSTILMPVVTRPVAPLPTPPTPPPPPPEPAGTMVLPAIEGGYAHAPAPTGLGYPSAPPPGHPSTPPGYPSTPPGYPSAPAGQPHGSVPPAFSSAPPAVLPAPPPAFSAISNAGPSARPEGAPLGTAPRRGRGVLWVIAASVLAIGGLGAAFALGVMPLPAALARRLDRAKPDGPAAASGVASPASETAAGRGASEPATTPSASPATTASAATSPSVALSTPSPSGTSAPAATPAATPAPELLSFQAYLTVDSEPGLDVVVQGVVVGPTNTKNLVRCGAKNVRLRAPNGGPFKSAGEAIRVECMQSVRVAIAAGG